MRLIVKISFLTALIMALLVTPAFAAKSDEILRDAADGYIDGNYSLADLRAADRAVSAQEREYYAWDEAFEDAIARLSNPEAPRAQREPVTIKPVDLDGNGTIDATERAKAEAQEDLINQRIKAANQEILVDRQEKGITDVEDPGTEKTADKTGEESSSWGLLTILFLLVAAPFIAIGIREIRKNRKGSGKKK